MWLELCLSFWVTCLFPFPLCFLHAGLISLPQAWQTGSHLRAFVLALPSAWNDFTRLIMTSSIFSSDFSLNVNNLERSIKYKLGIWFLSHHSILPFYIASFLLSDIDHAIVFLTVFLLLDCKFESGAIISHVHCYTFSAWNHSWHSKCLLSLLVKSDHSF